MKAPTGQKENPGSVWGRLSRGFQLALFEALYPGDLGGAGDGEVTWTGLLTIVTLHEPARAICDGQHVLELCRSQSPETLRPDPICASSFPRPSPFGVLL